MEKIYQRASDLHVVARKAYVKNGDVHAYSDVATTVQIEVSELHDMFIKGIVIVDAGVEYNAVSYKEAAGVGTITYVKTDGTVATTAVLATVTSKAIA